MRYFLFLFSILFLASCKQPLPVYFDQPIGTKVQGFDTSIAGNYIPLDDVLDKGTKEFTSKYTVKYDKIIRKDTAFSIQLNGKDLNYDEVKDIIGIKKDSGKIDIDPAKCDSVFKTFTAFNELISAKFGSSIDKAFAPQKPKAGMVKISYDRIFFIAVDSLGNNFRDTLVTLGPKTQLTKYAGKYFLNFRTKWGWEILQLDVWENKFLSARPFYFTSYDDCTANPVELTASTKNIYPDLKPFYNSEKKVIGFSAVLDAKLLLDKFKKSNESILMMKVK